MAKLGCLCGHVIRDQSDNQAHVAMVIPEKAEETLWNYLENKVSSLTDSYLKGFLPQWGIDNFGPSYKANWHKSTGSMITDLFFHRRNEIGRSIYQCENCGRIALQVGDSNHFKFFKPDEPEESFNMLDWEEG